MQPVQACVVINLSTGSWVLGKSSGTGLFRALLSAGIERDDIRGCALDACKPHKLRAMTAAGTYFCCSTGLWTDLPSITARSCDGALRLSDGMLLSRIVCASFLILGQKLASMWKSSAACVGDANTATALRPSAVKSQRNKSPRGSCRVAIAWSTLQ